MKTVLAVIVLAILVAIALSGCITPRIGLGYDFINQRMTVSVEPGGKQVVKPEK